MNSVTMRTSASRGSLRRIARLALLAVAALGAVAAGGIAARADNVADFYKGKTVTIQVGYGPGGGYDLTARLIARFLGNHIPGKPTVVVQNAPGGGGMKTATSIAKTVAVDGLMLGVFAFDIALEPYYDANRAMFDPARFAWIGSMDTDLQYCGVWKGAGVGIKTLPDLIASKKTIIFGSSAPGTVPNAYPLFFKNALGAPVKVVNGYTGTKDIILAMQRGEVDASCGLFESAMRNGYMDDIASGALRLIMHGATDDAFPFFADATPIMSVMKDDNMRKLARLVFSPANITRPLAAPPATPPERVLALREALMKTVRDPEAIAAAKTMAMNLQPKTSAEIDAVIADFKSASPALLKEVYSLTHE